MRILVTFAVEAEFAPWRRLRNLREEEAGGVTLYQAEIGRALVDFVVTGMGAENATRGVEAAMSRPYNICVASGFAGALKPGLAVGAIVTAETVQQLGKAETFSGSRNLAWAAECDGAARVKLLSSDHVIRTAEEKAQLAPCAGAVDMESFAVLGVAATHNLPAVAIRVISDTSDGEIPAFVNAMLDEKGRVKASGALREIAKHPFQVPALIRLGRDSKTAAEALANFLEAFINKLSLSSHGLPPQELHEVAAR
jgi:adenosylhomocysteine nucleosidase